jgi:phage N-6-adenine-methyltransferase
MFSSKSDMWSTPQEFFNELDKDFNFTLDVCATADNAKCPEFYTPEIDGLLQDWKGVCWCNPPYGRGVGKWVEKAAKSSATVVMLLPARTDTKWFHNWILPFAKFRFVPGRLEFSGKGRAPFPVMIAVFNDHKMRGGIWLKSAM